MLQKSNLLVRWSILLAIIATLVLSLVVLVKIFQESQRTQQLNHHDPGYVVNAFLHALSRNDLDFAKKFVIPEQAIFIDKWASESNHQAFECPIDWSRGLNILNEGIEYGGSSYFEIKNNKTTVDASITCRFSHAAINIAGVVLVYNGSNWKITGWVNICEAAICYFDR